MIYTCIEVSWNCQAFFFQYRWYYDFPLEKFKWTFFTQRCYLTSLVEADQMLLKKTVNTIQRESGTHIVKEFIVQEVTNSIIYVNRQINIILTKNIWFVSVLHFVRINNYTIVGLLKETKNDGGNTNSIGLCRKYGPTLHIKQITENYILVNRNITASFMLLYHS